MSALGHWSTCPRPEPLAHAGAFVRLEPLDPARHGDDLFAAGSGPGAEGRWRYLMEPPYADRVSFEDWLTRASASPDALMFVAVDRESGRAEGRLALMRIDPPHGVIEIGSILFGARIARTRAATEAVYLLTRHVFEDLGYRRLEWKCDDRNEPSKRAARRFGFGFEGLFRQHMVVKGANRDTAWFAMLDDEWPQRKAAFQGWLAAANFDEEGRQRLSLGTLNFPRLAHEDMVLRRAGISDLAALTALQQAAYAPNAIVLGAEPLPLRAEYRVILQTHEVWLLPGRGDPLGALILDPKPDHLLVWSLAVAPSAQARGLGNRLLAAAETRAQHLGLSTLRLYTGEKLDRNVRWYASKGYAVERIEPLEDRRLVHMIKTLGE